MPQNLWPEKQHGREITVYIYTHDDRYCAAMDGLPYTAHEVTQMRLTKEFEIGSDRLWHFVRDCEASLAAHAVRRAGCASGDKSLGAYASIRNEAFTIQRVKQPSDGRLVQMALMPSNADGWNAAADRVPMALDQCEGRDKVRVSGLLRFCMFCILFALLAYLHFAQ